MYVMPGGCTSIFNLAVKFPLIVAALTLAGLADQIPEKMGPGDRHGTAGYLQDVRQKIENEHPQIAQDVVRLREEYERLNPEVTEGMVNHVLAITDACTDVRARDVLSDPDERREAGWLYYLDHYARGAPPIDRFFYERGSPPKQE